VLITQLVKELNVSVSEVVEHFAKQQKEAKPLAKEENVKINAEMTEGKNEISVSHIDIIAEGLRHK
jgi:hypothetical protein